MKSKTYLAINIKGTIVEVEGERENALETYDKGTITKWYGNHWTLKSMREAISQRKVAFDENTLLQIYVKAWQESLNLETDDEDYFPYNVENPN